MDKNIKKSVILKINPELYPLDVIYSAAYIFLNRAYVFLDGNPEKEILVSLESKSNEDIEKLKGEFLNEMINYADYKERSKNTKNIRETILLRALFTNDPSIADKDPEFDELIKELEKEDNSVDSDEVIAPWGDLEK